jgi:hypothetical protein
MVRKLENNKRKGKMVSQKKPIQTGNQTCNHNSNNNNMRLKIVKMIFSNKNNNIIYRKRKAEQLKLEREKLKQIE